MWEKTEIQIATVNGKIPRIAYVLKDSGLAVHHDLDNPKYWIHTHIKSGCNICRFKYATLKKAKKYAELMAETEIDWNMTGKELTAKYTNNDFRKIVNEVYYGEKK